MDEKWTAMARIILAEATVKEATDQDIDAIAKSSPEFVQSFKNAASDYVGKDGKPRMLLVTAWMAHEGRNGNGQAFVRQELERKVQEGLFIPPHAGIIDFNHDFEPRGYWYKTSFAYDPASESWGIVASGAVWAWRFPELADALLAEMHREGTVAVSMAALPESTEYTRNYPGFEGQYTEILHNPVFFATSLLNIPPADPYGRANVSEIDVDVPVPAAQEDEESEVVLANQHEEDKPMDKELELQEKLDSTEAQLKEAQDKVQELEEEKAGLASRIEELTSKVTGFEAKVAELELALQSVSEIKQELEEQLEQASTQLAEIESERIEKEKDERLDDRIASLPARVQKNLEAHPEVDEIRASWREMSDEEWASVRRSFDLASDSPDYVARSEEEGSVPARKSDSDGANSGLSQYIKR